MRTCDITLYQLTNSAFSAAQLYCENDANNFYRAPRSWAERSYHKLVYFNEVDKGGHFASWEQPERFSVEIRAALRSLRQSI
jgi:hypothetical protein